MDVPRWNEDTTLKFVQEYRVRECLWNTKSAVYKNRNAREAALKQIEEIMGIEGFGVAEIKNKIKALHSTYSQEFKKIKDSKKSGAGTDSVYVSHVKWFQEMHTFLHCLDNKRPTQDNLTQETSTPNNVGSDSSDHETPVPENDQSTTPRQSTDDIATAPTPRIQAPPPSKRNKSNIQQVSAVLKDLKQIASDVTKESIDNEFVIFGKSVAAQLQKLTTVNALVAQEEIQSLLTRARIRELQSVSAAPKPTIHELQDYASTSSQSPSSPPSYSHTSYHQGTERSNDTNVGYSEIVSQALSDLYTE